MASLIPLRIRIYALLTAVMLITLAGGVMLVWYTFRMEALLTSITEEHLAAFQSAEALETALVNQKGFVSYYFIDGDPDWLRRLGEYRRIFQTQLLQAKNLARTPAQNQAIEQLESQYNRYIAIKDRVIDHYMKGERRAGAALHGQVRDDFFQLLNLSEAYREMHAANIQQAREKSAAEARNLRKLSYAAILTDFMLAIFLVYVLVHHILSPVRTLLAEANHNNARKSRFPDEIQALSNRVRGLIEDVDSTHSELRRSRENLLQAEKMALVGRLAAGMAHGIRNPFTSIKMRLFSLGRTLKLNEAQKEDFEVISEEIRHVDNIVQNFLEFSRPPKLKMQSISPSVIVDQVLQLLEHRLNAYEVKTELERRQPLPDVSADAEQIKEVLVNIIVNACEAMGRGGRIRIVETVHPSAGKPETVRIRIADSGPGIPPDQLDQVFQPFHTTKEEGTGLGLSIAARIVAEHGGKLEACARESEGATFTISLPVRAQTPRPDTV
ncbi:MAG TPA: ATP-binding protein [Desulfobacterales bacterium]